MLAPFLTLTYVQNRGAAFGILPGSQVLFLAVSFLLLAGIGILHRTLFSPKLRPADAGAVLMAAGTLGNLFDRIRLGYVVDFLELPYWPVFNLADTALVVGTGFILLGVIRAERAGREQPLEGPGKEYREQSETQDGRRGQS